ncbi:MAG TPA: hypothetical protein VNZ64_27030 [Candidatus Acidoferrum sp.]|jgi:hypothetical protein|nr:hypothetical protein [Candidatus Acidoferrum sp.]
MQTEQTEPQLPPTTPNAQPALSTDLAPLAPSDGERAAERGTLTAPTVHWVQEIRDLAAQPAINHHLATINQLTSHQLSTVNHPSSIALATVDQPAPTVIDARPLAVRHHKSRRRGRIANLPKPHRDMVNRMLSNGVPYKNIVAALAEAGFSVVERNISRWATGGHLEWRLEQDLILQNRLDQDHLVDHLRREDASELPEVGLQAAATRLSQILLQKIANADNVEANLGTFSQIVDLLCRLNRELGTLQKQRDDSRRSLGAAYDPARIKNEDQNSTLERERLFSDPDDPDSGLAGPAVPPLLPPIPTSTTLEVKDLQDALRRQRERNNHVREIMKAFNPKKDPASTVPALLPPTEPAP